jgi:DNA polymerase-3 subunit gamma/tau
VHGRELLTVQVLGEVPPELRVTRERDRRLLEQAQALTDTDAIRLLDLVAAALDATANGAQARIQLELVLVKAAAPELDPSMAALLARIERLEKSGGAGLRRVEAPPPAAAPPPPARAVAAANAAPAPAPVPAREPEPEPVAVPVALELETAISAWPAVVDLVRGKNVMLGALLADAKPVAVGERELIVAFPGGAAFLKRKAEQDDYRRMTAEALRAVTGHQLTLRYELRDEEQAGDEEMLSGEELVRRFLEEFDAEEIPEEA